MGRSRDIDFSKLKLNMECEGVVIFMDYSKGYGFLRIDGTEEDAFLHYRDIHDYPFTSLMRDDRVKFLLVNGHKGLCAKSVRKI